MALREFDSVQVGDKLPEKVIPLTRTDLVNYAGVSGDLNPIHWDDEIAKQVGSTSRSPTACSPWASAVATSPHGSAIRPR